MTHLTMDQFLALREPGAEPGTQAALDHLEACSLCQTEFEQLHQRVARLRALPALRPTRNRFLAVRAELSADRRRRQARWAGIGGLALAASVALVVVTLPNRPDIDGVTAGLAEELTETISRSQQLERALVALEPEARVIDGRTSAITGRLEDRLQLLDRELQAADRLDRQVRMQEQLKLWRERVGLLDALVDVHVTRASYAGL